MNASILGVLVREQLGQVKTRLALRVYRAMKYSLQVITTLGLKAAGARLYVWIDLVFVYW
jgi:hypothetical protein